MSSLDKLLRISGPALSSAPPSGTSFFEPWGKRGRELSQLLAQKNGFVAFLSALHVFPLKASPSADDLAGWNADGLWKSEYAGLMSSALFFAEDLFGGQFCIRDEQIFTFEPERGKFTLLAPDLEGWASKLLEEYDVLTGSKLAREWQEMYGALPAGKRLAPRTPFIAGGKFEAENLYPSDPAEAMRFRGYLANQIKDLPDGAKIELKATE